MERINYNSLNIVEFIDKINPNNSGILFSIIFHLIILLFAVGLPNLFGPKEVFVPNIIPIEIINISETTNAIKSDTSNQNNKNIKTKQKKFNSSEITEVQKEYQVVEKNKKKNADNQPVIELKEKANFEIKSKNNIEVKQKEIPQNNNLIETIKLDKIKPKLKPKLNKPDPSVTNSDLQIETNNKQENKLNEKKTITKPKPKPKEDFSIASVLKDLRNDSSNNVVEEEDATEEDEKQPGENELQENNDELKITLGMKAMQQLQGCASIDSGQLKDYVLDDQQFIKTQAKYKKNGKIIPSSIRIIDINVNYNLSKYIESKVIFALNTCNLNLPEEYYDLWKTITMTWDIDKILNFNKSDLNLF